MTTDPVAQPDPAEEQPLSERLAAEADGDTQTPRPAGAPELWPFSRLPRRQRAAFLRSMSRLSLQQQTLEQMRQQASDGEVSPEIVADFYDLVADVEATLLEVCPPDSRDAFTEWALQATDNAVLELMTWYAERFDVGEAKASPA